MSNWLSLPDVLDENEKRIDDEMQRLFPSPAWGWPCSECKREFSTERRLEAHARRTGHPR